MEQEKNKTTQQKIWYDTEILDNTPDRKLFKLCYKKTFKTYKTTVWACFKCGMSIKRIDYFDSRMVVCEKDTPNNHGCKQESDYVLIRDVEIEVLDLLKKTYQSVQLRKYK